MDTHWLIETQIYLQHWWQGDLALHYQPWGYTMSQLNKILQLAQYATGLLTAFELIRINDVAGKLRMLTIAPAYVVHFLLYLLNAPNLVLRTVTGLYLAARGQRELLPTLHDALLDHIWTAKSEAETRAQALDSQLQQRPSQRFFTWLECHPLISERAIRILTFLSFALLTLAEILTAPS